MFFQIISVDYLSQNFFVMSFGVWVIGLVDSAIEHEWSIFIFIVAALCTPLGLFFFSRRYGIIQSAFQSGREATGHILEVTTISTGRRSKDFVFDYEYNFDGQTYQFRHRAKGTPESGVIKPGQSVTLMVNEKDPSSAFIKDIFLVHIK
jgi:hypothetical protein